MINVCAFDGNETVRADDLENTSVHSEYKAEDAKIHEGERDIAKYWKQKGSAIALYGIENQSQVDYTMPFRIIGYDGASYRSQILAKNKKIVPVASLTIEVAKINVKDAIGVAATYVITKVSLHCSALDDISGRSVNTGVLSLLQ